MKKHARTLRPELAEIEYPQLYERLAETARAVDSRVGFLRTHDVRDLVLRDQTDILAMGTVCTYCDDGVRADDAEETGVVGEEGTEDAAGALLPEIEANCIAYVSPDASAAYGLATGQQEWNASPDMLRIHGFVAEKNFWLQLLQPFLSAIVGIFIGCICFLARSGGNLFATWDHLVRVMLPSVFWSFLEGLLNFRSWSSFAWSVVQIVIYLWSVRSAYVARDKYRIRVREIREELTRHIENLRRKSRLVIQQANIVRKAWIEKASEDDAHGEEISSSPTSSSSSSSSSFLDSFYARAESWARDGRVQAFLELGDRKSKRHISRSLDDAEVLALRWDLVHNTTDPNGPFTAKDAEELEELTSVAAWIRMWRVLTSKFKLRPVLPPEDDDNDHRDHARPNVAMEGMRYPEAVLHGTEAVPADWDSSANDLITGANATGKTTYMKTVMLNLLLAHHAGVGFFERCTFAPNFMFTDFRCFVNVPDTSGRDSLFQAEARQAREIMRTWEETEKEDEFTFTILDEAFTGTRPEDATRATRALLDFFQTKVAHQRHVFMLTTHFTAVAQGLRPASSALRAGDRNGEEVENEKMIESSSSSVSKAGAESPVTGPGLIRCRCTSPGYRIVDGVCERSSAAEVLRALDFPESFLATWDEQETEKKTKTD